MRDFGEVGRLRALAVTVLFAAVLVAVPLARAAGPRPLPASEIAQDVTLSEGAAAGVVHLKPKGGFDGDVVAVDPDGARIPGKAVVARVRIQFGAATLTGSR